MQPTALTGGIWVAMAKSWKEAGDGCPGRVPCTHPRAAARCTNEADRLCLLLMALLRSVAGSWTGLELYRDCVGDLLGVGKIQARVHPHKEPHRGPKYNVVAGRQERWSFGALN